MDILSYPVGLLIGLFPVVVDLEGHAGTARLRLDGVPVCEISVRAPACMVDLGPAPRMHTLDLEMLDENGKVVESLRRWVNRPGVEGKVRAVGSCDQTRRECSFQIQWAHPSKLDPISLAISLDGKTLVRRPASSVRIPFPGKSAPQVLTIEAGFGDGSRAAFTKLLRSSYPEEAHASLQHVALELAPGETADNLESRLREAGWKLRAVEEGDAEILFVVEPWAFAHHPEVTRANLTSGLRPSPFEESWLVATFAADESLTMVRAYSRGRWATKAATTGRPGEQMVFGRATSLPRGSLGFPVSLVAVSSQSGVGRVRLADAVAAAGYDLGGAPRRRLIVLVLGDERLEEEHPDQSTFSPEQARAYLGQAQVPLIVWRIGGGASPDWPRAEPITSSEDLLRGVAIVKQRIGRQRVAWLEGAVDPGAFSPRLPEGISIAGRDSLWLPPVASSQTPVENDGSGSESQLRNVYSVVAHARTPDSIFAAGHEGLFLGSDSGKTWKRVSTGRAGPVFALAMSGKDRSEILAGGSGSFLRRIPGGQNWSSFPLPAVLTLAVDPADPSIVYAGMSGRILKSTNGGLNWADSSNGIAKTLSIALAVDPREHSTVYSGTVGGGVFKSTDAGKSWKPSGKELRFTAVRCLAVDPSRNETIYAGTDGGVFVSVHGGKSWKGARGPHAVVYALVLDPDDPQQVFAGTAVGLWGSRDGARTWNRVNGSDAGMQVTSLALDTSSRRLYAGTLGHGVVVVSVR